jgi:hypothetical protein
MKTWMHEKKEHSLCYYKCLHQHTEVFLLSTLVHTIGSVEWYYNFRKHCCNFFKSSSVCYQCNTQHTIKFFHRRVSCTASLIKSAVSTFSSTYFYLRNCTYHQEYLSRAFPIEIISLSVVFPFFLETLKSCEPGSCNSAIYYRMHLFFISRWLWIMEAEGRRVFLWVE